MSRLFATLALLAALAAPAAAQPRARAVAPGFRPAPNLLARPAVPYTPFAPGYGRTVTGFGYGYGYGYGFAPFYGYPLNSGSNITVNVNPPVAAPAEPERAIARLSVVLPSPGEVWLNGAKAGGDGTDFRFESPPLAPRDTFPFRVRAEWAAGGTRVGAEQTVVVGAGERRQLAFGAGEPVK